MRKQKIRGHRSYVPQIEYFASGSVRLQFRRLVNVFDEKNVRKHVDVFSQFAGIYGRIITKIKSTNFICQFSIALVVENNDRKLHKLRKCVIQSNVNSLRIQSLTRNLGKAIPHGISHSNAPKRLDLLFL